jgi:hypothetical protein
MLEEDAQVVFVCLILQVFFGWSKRSGASDMNVSTLGESWQL